MKKITSLYLTQCFILELPEGGIDCDSNTDNDTNCIQCTSVARFLAGGTVNDYYGGGQLTCLFLGIVTILVGLSAGFMSYVIVAVLKRQNRGTSFEMLLTVLAYTDMFCGLAQAGCIFCVIIYCRNWSRDWPATTAYMYSPLFAILGRCASSFLTVVIATERYLVIAFPLQTRNWFTPRSAKIVGGVALLLAFLLSVVPRATTQYVGFNRFKDVPSVSHLDYVIYHSSLAKFWYEDLKGSTRIDFLLPLPLLLALNGLIFYHIRKYSLQRRELTTKVTKELHSGKMFLSVMVVLLLCNIPPIIFAYFHHRYQAQYLELAVGIFLSAAVNSAANLPIYYLKAPGFSKEARQVMRTWFPYFIIASKPQTVDEPVGAAGELFENSTVTDDALGAEVSPSSEA